MSTDYSEDTLVEQPAIALFEELGYETANCFHESVGTDNATYGRQTTEEVILADKLRAELVSLGHEVPPRVLQEGGVTATSSADAELTEQTRLLQLRIDFYQAQHDEYTRLFENYLALDRPMRAKGVIEALDREIIRVRLRVDSEPDFLEQANLEDEILVLREMQKTMRSQLPESLDEGE